MEIGVYEYVWGWRQAFVVELYCDTLLEPGEREKKKTINTFSTTGHISLNGVFSVLFAFFPQRSRFFIEYCNTEQTETNSTDGINSNY